MKLEAVAYLRVSSVNQLEGNGFERQEKAISKYARSKYSLTNVYKEQGVSGTITDRPALMTMMTDLIVNNRPKVVLVESADRLGRSLEGEPAGLLLIKTMTRAKHGTSAIARALTEAGHPTRTGTAWSRQAVHAIVTRLKS